MHLNYKQVSSTKNKERLSSWIIRGTFLVKESIKCNRYTNLRSTILSGSKKEHLEDDVL